MKGWTWRALFLGTALATAPAWAEPPLARQLAVETLSRTTVEFDLGAARIGDRVEMPLPGARLAKFTIEKVTKGASSTVLQAHADGERNGSTVLSLSGASAFGTIIADGRTYNVDTGADGVARVVDLAAAGLREPPQPDDTIVPPAPPPSTQPTQNEVESAIPAGNTIVDIGFFYTPSMVTRYGLGLGGRFNALLDRLNLGLTNSNVPISYVLGYLGPVTYSETVDPGDMLLDLRLGNNNANGDLSAVPGIRTAKGLDIISAHRVFQHAEHDACGTGYVIGGGGQGNITAGSSGFGFNTVLDGVDLGGAGFLCSIDTMAHESGHNMGLTHNREDASGPGVFSYSYGWRVEGSFRTIMAYGSATGEPRLTLFSDPDVVSCVGQPCGRPIGELDEANNGQSLRNVGGNVSTFRARTSDIYAATLPGSRWVQLGTTATAFGTIINDSASTAQGCGIMVHGAPDGSFSFQTTNPATNQLTGTPNTPVDIPAHGVQTYVFAITATAAYAGSELPVAFYCANRRSATSVVGLNTLFYGASSTPRADMIALVDTLSHDGIAVIPGVGQSTAFVVAASNVGSAASVTVTPDTGASSLPLAMSICQTNTSTGVCLSPAASSVTTASIPNGGTASFSIFLTATGPIVFDPAGTRVFVRFRQSSTTVGSTSVAVRAP